MRSSVRGPSHGVPKGKLSHCAFTNLLAHEVIQQDYEIIDHLAACGFVPADYAAEARAVDARLVTGGR